MARTPLSIIKVGLLVIVIALTAFTRFYRLGETYNFHNDEGRDMLITARMIWEKRPVLLGPQTSTGNMYLGPLYYYLMVPPLYYADFDPIGPSVMISFFAIVTSYLLFRYLDKHHGILGATAGGLVFALLPVVVSFTKSSWNPNLIPFVSLVLLLVTSSLYKRPRQLKLWLGLGILTGILAQLHYVALVMPAVCAGYLLIFRCDHFKHRLTGFALVFAGFLLATTPFWLFELRHNFVNSQAFLSFLTEHNSTPAYGSYLTRLQNNFVALMDNLVGSKPYRTTPTPWVQISLAWAVVFVSFFAREHLIKLIASLFPLSLIAFSILDEKLQIHYFGYLFPLFAILLGYQLTRSRLRYQLLGLVTLCLVLGFNLPILSSRLKMDPEVQPEKAAAVAKYIREAAMGYPYNVSPGSSNSRDTTYLYYLYRKNPVPTSTHTELLFLICEGGACSQDDLTGPHLYARGPSHPALADYLGHPYQADFRGERELIKHEHVAYDTWVATLKVSP